MKGDTVKLVSVGTVTLATFVARAADGSTELVNPATGATITLTTKAEMKTLVRVKKAAVVPKVRVRSIPSWAAAAASSTADVAVKPIALVTITKTKVDKWGYVNVASLSVSSLISHTHTCSLSSYFLSLILVPPPLKTGMDILREMAESSILETVTKDILKPLKEHQGIVVKDCLHIALDITCNAQFRKCRDTDCMPPPDQCFTDAQSRLVDNIVQCVSTKCTENAFANTTQCNSITASSLAQSSRLIWDTVKEHITGTLTNSDGTVNTEAVNAFQSFCDLIVYYFDQRVTNQDVPLIPMEQCNAWTVDLLNTDVVESNSNTFKC